MNKKEKRPPQSKEETANQCLSDSSKPEPPVKPATAHERLDKDQTASRRCESQA